MCLITVINSKKCLFICNGGSCMKNGAEEVTQAIRKSISDFNLDDDYPVSYTHLPSPRDQRGCRMPASA